MVTSVCRADDETSNELFEIGLGLSKSLDYVSLSHGSESSVRPPYQTKMPRLANSKQGYLDMTHGPAARIIFTFVVFNISSPWTG